MNGGVVVMVIDIGFDGRDEFFDITKNATAKTVLGEIAKEPLHYV